MVDIHYQVIGRILLLILTIFSSVLLTIRRLHAIFWMSYDYWRQPSREQWERAILEQCKQNITKIPRHLVLIISPEDNYVNMEMLQQIFNYALLVDIKHVSVYDRRDPKDGYVDLDQFCEHEQDSNRCFTWRPSQPSPPSKTLKEMKKCNGHTISNDKINGYTNGVNHHNNQQHHDEVQVYKISVADGRPLIADICRELYVNRQSTHVQNLLQDRSSLSDHIGAMLDKRLGWTIPEPELGIIFAEQDCTYGLLPWHTRFTEFHAHPTGAYFNASTFAKVLYKYARCEQRWGK